MAAARNGWRISCGQTLDATDPGELAGGGLVEDMQLDDLGIVELLDRHDALDEELRVSERVPGATADRLRVLEVDVCRESATAKRLG